MSYRVTTTAAADLVRIARYTHTQWGTDRAAAYIQELFQAFERLTEIPPMGRQRDDLRPGLRITLHHQHYFICYRVEGDEVQILRVVHTRRDLARQIAALGDSD